MAQIEMADDRPLTVEEVYELKRILALDILGQLKAFEKRTNCSISAVELYHEHIISQEQPDILGVTLRVSL